MNTAPPETTLEGLIRSRPRFRLETCSGAVLGSEVLGSLTYVGGLSRLAGKSVLIGAKSQLAAARAMIELDGFAARLVICPPDFSPERLASVIEQARVDAIVCEDSRMVFGSARPLFVIESAGTREERIESPRLRTQWLLPTSGTTGPPKLVAHSLNSLLGAIKGASNGPSPVWTTFYDIRRYGGLQIFLRACVAGATLALSDAEESLDGHIARCLRLGVTHISGTPSHWRRLLMNPNHVLLEPEYVRLSGEIADRAILSALREAYPKARVVHAYASTEGGVGFEVTDGMEGFPASLLDVEGEIELRLRDGSLHIRSPRTATSYVGRDDLQLRDKEGFVDTGDMLERIGERCFFKGRRTGVINVGGLKVHPEEVEQVINAYEKVRMSRVGARRNPIIGDIIAAEIVLREETATTEDEDALKHDILEFCRARLPRHMVPVTMRFVPALDVLASGKLARRHA